MLTIFKVRGQSYEQNKMVKVLARVELAFDGEDKLYATNAC